MADKCTLRKRRPSPVDLLTSRAKPFVKPPLQWSANYGELLNPVYVSCNNSLIQIHSEYPYESMIWGGPLKAKYIFDKINFHWALDNDRGSEHSFDGKFYPLEMQIIHTKLHSEEDNQAENYAVLSYIFEITDKFNNALQKILDKVPKSIKYVDEFITTESLQLSELIIKFNNHYLFYEGQITEPDFDDAFWIFCPCKLSVTTQQMCIFRKIAEYLPWMANNTAEIQPLFNRKIYYAI